MKTKTFKGCYFFRSGNGGVWVQTKRKEYKLDKNGYIAYVTGNEIEKLRADIEGYRVYFYPSEDCKVIQ